VRATYCYKTTMLCYHLNNIHVVALEATPSIVLDPILDQGRESGSPQSMLPPVSAGHFRGTDAGVTQSAPFVHGSCCVSHEESICGL